MKSTQTALPASKLLTPANVAHLFGVSLMTVTNWRKGTPTMGELKTTAVKDKPRNIGFTLAVVKAWAKDNGYTLAADPAVILQARATGLLAPTSKAKPVAKKKATAFHHKHATKTGGKMITALRENMKANKATKTSSKSVTQTAA